MNTTERLNRLILDIEGVTALYRPDPAWQQSAADIANVMAGEDHYPDASVAVRKDRNITTVHVRIGVDPASPAPAVARRVAAAIREDLSAAPPPTTTPADAKITVQISLIAIPAPASGTGGEPQVEHRRWHPGEPSPNPAVTPPQPGQGPAEAS